MELTASSGCNESRDDKLSLLLDDVDEEDDDDFVKRFVKLPYNDCGNLKKKDCLIEGKFRKEKVRKNKNVKSASDYCFG